MGLLQREVAELIGVQKDTITNWENRRSKPKIHLIPEIIKFLGYVPFKLKLNTVGNKIITYRKLTGMSQRELANELGIDQSTLKRWERNEGRPRKGFLNFIDGYLEKQINKSLDSS